MSRRRGTLIITSNHSESSSFVYTISRLWNTFRITPEGNEIKDFNISFSFIKNKIKKILHPHSDDDIRFTTQDIMDAIDDIKPHAAPGPDEIPPIVLKQCKEQLATPIHLIWSRSLASGSVPKCYKRYLVTPLYKKGSRALPSNYRPVSLTSHVIKLYERVVRKQLVTHLTSNNLMCRKQHGFQAGKSCLTQLLDHIDEIISNFQSGLDTDCIYLDFSKAFDKVDHALLLKKL